MKACTKCNIEKPLVDFYSHPKTVDGKQSSCKSCCVKQQKPYTKKYFQNNPQKANGNPVTIKEWRRKNPDYMKHYKQSNPQYVIACKHSNKLTRKQRMLTDPLFKFACVTRTLIHGSFKRACNGIYSKPSKSESILGCTIPEFISYIESMLKPDMTFENHGAGYGKWNLDHIIPISSATCEGDIIKLNHYTNFQPLWFEENMAKGNKM